MPVTLKMVTISCGKNYKYHNFMLYPSVMVSMVPATPKYPLNNKYVEGSLPDT